MPPATDRARAAGAAYVAAASVLLATAYAREGLTTRQEALAWATAWLGAVALWTVLLGAAAVVTTPGSHLAAVSGGLLLGTSCFLGWQVVALAVRQLIGWRSAR